MIRARSLRHIVVLLALLVSPLGTVRVSAQSQRAKDIGTHIKCLCKGCDMSAGGCAHPGGAFSGPCDTAIAEMKEIDEHLAQGQTEQQVIDAFIAKYGTIAYVEPPKHGFGLLAWLMPVIYTIVGLAIAVFVVKRWASRKPVLIPAAPARSTASQEALARARAQAARETED